MWPSLGPSLGPSLSVLGPLGLSSHLTGRTMMHGLVSSLLARAGLRLSRSYSSCARRIFLLRSFRLWKWNVAKETNMIPTSTSTKTTSASVEEKGGKKLSCSVHVPLLAWRVPEQGPVHWPLDAMSVFPAVTASAPRAYPLGFLQLNALLIDGGEHSEQAAVRAVAVGVEDSDACDTDRCSALPLSSADTRTTLGRFLCPDCPVKGALQ